MPSKCHIMFTQEPRKVKEKHINCEEILLLGENTSVLSESNAACYGGFMWNLAETNSVSLCIPYYGSLQNGLCTCSVYKACEAARKSDSLSLSCKHYKENTGTFYGIQTARKGWHNGRDLLGQIHQNSGENYIKNDIDFAVL